MRVIPSARPFSSHYGGLGPPFTHTHTHARTHESLLLIPIMCFTLRTSKCGTMHTVNLTTSVVLAQPPGWPLAPVVVSTKRIADVLEALVGAVFLSGRKTTTLVPTVPVSGASQLGTAYAMLQQYGVLGDRDWILPPQPLARQMNFTVRGVDSPSIQC